MLSMNQMSAVARCVASSHAVLDFGSGGGQSESHAPVAGTWRIVHGTPEFPDASVYQLDADASHGPILLLRVDDNLVLFLNQQRRPLPGTADFSDTLTRADH